jgi:hypothetical protein
MNGKIIAKKLHSIEDGILGVLNNPEIQLYLEKLGYRKENLTEGQQLLDVATRLMSSHVEVYSNQYIATDEMTKSYTASYARYITTLKIVRIAFKQQPEMLARFNATGRRNRSLSGWLRDARIFYTNLLDTPDALDALKRFDITDKQLNEEWQQVQQVEEMHSLQLKGKSGAQQSTVDRDKAIDAVCNWYSDFRAIARIALYDKPQLLEALGIVKK